MEDFYEFVRVLKFSFGFEKRFSLDEPRSARVGLGAPPPRSQSLVVVRQ